MFAFGFEVWAGAVNRIGPTPPKKPRGRETHIRRLLLMFVNSTRMPSKPEQQSDPL
jgi:hypothetical protein